MKRAAFEQSVFYGYSRSIDGEGARFIMLSGKPHYGIVQEPFQEINYLDFDYRNPMGQRQGLLKKRLVVDFPGELEIDAFFSEAEPRFEPMCITTRTGTNGWVHAQKVAGVRCHGQISSPIGRFDLSSLNAYAHHDGSGGYMRQETFWNWACLSGEVNGQRVGLNLSCGVNETSFTENCYWVDGTLIKVDSVKFEYNRDDSNSEWHITSYDGQIDLTFKPEAYHEEKQNLLVVNSNFKQFMGRFYGHIGDIPITDKLGFVEDQYVKW